MEMTDGYERTVTRNWDGNQNGRLVVNGPRGMTVSAKQMAMRTFGKETTDRDTVMTVGV